MNILKRLKVFLITRMLLEITQLKRIALKTSEVSNFINSSDHRAVAEFSILEGMTFILDKDRAQIYARVSIFDAGLTAIIEVNSESSSRTIAPLLAEVTELFEVVYIARTPFPDADDEFSEGPIDDTNNKPTLVN